MFWLLPIFLLVAIFPPPHPAIHTCKRWCWILHSYHVDLPLDWNLQLPTCVNFCFLTQLNLLIFFLSASTSHPPKSPERYCGKPYWPLSQIQPHCSIVIEYKNYMSACYLPNTQETLNKHFNNRCKISLRKNVVIPSAAVYDYLSNKSRRCGVSMCVAFPDNTKFIRIENPLNRVKHDTQSTVEFHLIEMLAVKKHRGGLAQLGILLVGKVLIRRGLGTAFVWVQKTMV